MLQKVYLNLISGSEILHSSLSAMNGGYDLVVIEESSVPLGAAPEQPSLYFITVVCLLVLLVIAGFIAFMVRRNALKKRILELRKKVGSVETTVRGNTRVLKDEITELETRATELMNSME